MTAKALMVFRKGVIKAFKSYNCVIQQFILMWMKMHKTIEQMQC